MHTKIWVLGFIGLFCFKPLITNGQGITDRTAAYTSDTVNLSKAGGAVYLLPAENPSVKISSSPEETIQYDVQAPPVKSAVNHINAGKIPALTLAAAITESGNPGSVNTTYGTPSVSASFTVSGAGLSAGITVTPPTGFEVSTDNVTFSSTITVGNAGITVPLPVYIRLAATSNAGDYSGNIVLSSNGAPNIQVAMPNSTVSPSILNITGTYSKFYGDMLIDFTLYYNTPGFTFNLAGLHNGNTFKSIKFAFGNGAGGTDAAGTYNGSVRLSDFEGDNGFLPGNYSINYFPFDLVVLPAPITITAGDISKPYGAALADEPASTDFTVTGLRNHETIGHVRISYGPGAAASSAAGLYRGSVVPSDAMEGTFSPGNYQITYKSGDLNVAAAAPPVINYTGLPSALQTIYGTPSAVTTIQVSGSNLTSAIIITPPPGFEISTNNNSFSSSITLMPATVAVATTIIYIRLAAVTPAGNYTGNLTLNSQGASLNAVLRGTVDRAPLTVTAQQVTKTYGTELRDGEGSAGFTTEGLQNGETAGTVTWTYGNGSAAGDPVGNYTASALPSAAAGGSFNSSNYNITYIPSDIVVNRAQLTITADNLSRAFAMQNPTLTVTYTGFVNNEGPAQLQELPIVSTSAVLSSPVGQYPIMVNAALASNYDISYVPGTLTIYSDPENIKVPNAFTPNSDGNNDLWNIKDLQYYPDCSVEIYNRYGQVLYRSHGYSQAWDGTYNGRSLPLGTYYYMISLNDGTPTRLSGYVAIIK